MIGLLTAFFLYSADASWHWWVAFVFLALADVLNFVRNH